jgi:hypothetical protein
MGNRKKVIPLLDTRSEQTAVAARADKIRLLIKGGRWSFDETLRALSAVVFYSGRKRRERLIAWLEELLDDLKNPRVPLESETVDAWKDSTN